MYDFRLMVRINGTIILLSILVPWPTEQTTIRMKEAFSWKWIDYQFENASHRQQMIDSNQFIPGNSIPTSIGLWSSAMFIATPRFKLGVPATLSYIFVNDTDTHNNSSPLLIPYPSWEGHDIQQRNITSVLNVHVDPCDRLWVLDSGQIEYRRETDASLLAYDLRTNRLIESYKIKTRTDYKNEAFFSDLVVDVTSSSCDNAYAYLADAKNNEITIFTMRTREFHKITHNYFHFDPLAGDLHIDDVHHRTQYGISSLAMSPVGRDDHRVLFFSPLASNMQFAVSTRVLQNRTLDPMKSFYEFKVVGTRGPNTQTSASTFDEETGVLFYTLIAKNAIGCWNSFSGDEFDEKTQGTIVENPDLIYPSDVETDKKGLLWAVFNRFWRFKHGELNKEEINIRILNGPVRSLIKGTVCDAM